MTHVTFSLTADLLARLDESVSEHSTNRSKIIVQAIEAYLSDSFTVDITQSYSPDKTKVLLLEQDVIHKDKLLAERERLINVYQSILGGRAVPVVKPIRVGFWRRVFHRQTDRPAHLVEEHV